jgi:hypothetical protein
VHAVRGREDVLGVDERATAKVKVFVNERRHEGQLVPLGNLAVHNAALDKTLAAVQIDLLLDGEIVIVPPQLVIVV